MRVQTSETPPYRAGQRLWPGELCNVGVKRQQMVPVCRCLVAEFPEERRIGQPLSAGGFSEQYKLFQH